jgi:hypothetical protein
LRRRLDAEQIGRETDIGKIDLRRLNEAFADVCEPRTEAKRDEGRFRDGYPVLDGSRADANFPGEAVEVYELPDPAREECDLSWFDSPKERISISRAGTNRKFNFGFVPFQLAS